MPTIFRPVKKQYKRTTETIKTNSLIHRHVYNTVSWRVLRIEKLKNSPLCECPSCKTAKIVILAHDVHHIIPISTAGDNVEKIKALGFAYDNLMSVSRDCHKKIHAELKEKIEYLNW